MAGKRGKGSVVQSWVAERCSWKEQTVLLTGLRGPDSGTTDTMKSLVRWMRGVILQNASPKEKFMKKDAVLSIYAMDTADPAALGMISVHYFGHLMHCLQVIANRHPDDLIYMRSKTLYCGMVEYLHLKEEDQLVMEERLEDRI